MPDTPLEATLLRHRPAIQNIRAMIIAADYFCVRPGAMPWWLTLARATGAQLTGPGISWPVQTSLPLPRIVEEAAAHFAQKRPLRWRQRAFEGRAAQF